VKTPQTPKTPHIPKPGLVGSLVPENQDSVADRDGSGGAGPGHLLLPAPLSRR